MNDQTKAAMTMALEALEGINQMCDYEGNDFKLEEEITALREALAQPQGEWVDLTDDEKYDLNEKYHNSDGKPIRLGYDDAIVAKFKEKNTPPVVPQGEWVDLTDEDIAAVICKEDSKHMMRDATESELVRATIAKFKEKTPRQLCRKETKMLTKERLHELFEYRDGNLFWKIAVAGMPIGRKAGNMRPDGYIQLTVDKKNYRGHRLIFMLHHGYMPVYIDHINGNRSDNRIENLRDATSNENNQNSTIRKDNKSGVKGVYFNKNANKWAAQIRVDKRINHLGYFTDLDVAAEAVRIARLNLHKEYANHG